MAPFTKEEQIALAIAPKITAALSIIGSSYIIWKVFHRRIRTIKHRLLLGLSAHDLVFSFASFLTTWPSPSGTKGVFGAVGTVATCTAQGFCFNYAFGCAMYNAFLAVYFVLVVRHNFREEQLRNFERCAHVAAFVWPTVINVLAITDNAFNNAQQVCWVAPFPPRCKGESCIRGKHAVQIRLFGTFPTVMISIVVATISMLLMYFAVRSREKDTFTEIRGERILLERAQRRKSRMVLKQAFLYLSAMYLTWGFSIASRWIFIFTGKAYFPLTLIRSVLNPSQGMFNVLIYMRPSIQRLDRRPLRRRLSFVSTVRGSFLTRSMERFRRLNFSERRTSDLSLERMSIDNVVKRNPTAQKITVGKLNQHDRDTVSPGDPDKTESSYNTNKDLKKTLQDESKGQPSEGKVRVSFNDTQEDCRYSVDIKSQSLRTNAMHESMEKDTSAMHVKEKRKELFAMDQKEENVDVKDSIHKPPQEVIKRTDNK